MEQQTGWDWKKILLVVVGAAGVLVFALVGLTAVGFVWATSTVEQLGDPVLEPVARSGATDVRRGGSSTGTARSDVSRGHAVGARTPAATSSRPSRRHAPHTRYRWRP